MLPRERFLAALRGDPVDHVPYFEYSVHPDICQALLGEPLKRPQKRVYNRAFGMCDVEFWRKPPVFTEDVGRMGGRAYQGHGAIRSRDDLPKLQLPEPAPAEVVEAAHRFCEEKEEFAAGLVVSIGMDPLLMSMGYEPFSYALVDDPELPLEILKRYCAWTAELVGKLRGADFDFLLAGDDMAHKTAPFFSPRWFHDRAKPIIRELTDTFPWPLVQHCDGNVEPLFEDLMDLGVVALHPIEPEAMDIFDLKRKYGDRLTLIGNIDINNLALGTPQSVREEVRDKLARLAPGGRYVIASSTCIPEYADPENFRAMVETIREYA